MLIGGWSPILRRIDREFLGIAYHEKFLSDETLPDGDERKLLSALIAISTGVEDVTKLNVPVEVGRKLIQCYDELGDESAIAR